MTQRNLYTDCTQKFYRPTFCIQKLYPEQFLHCRNLFARKPLRTKKYVQQFLQTDSFYTKNSPHRSLTHRRFYAQQQVFFFFTYTRFYTQMSLHRHKLHTETCAHSTRLHTANFYTERLYFPFLITYLSCSPSQLPFATRAMIHLLSEMNHQVGTRMYIYIYIYVYIYMYIYTYVLCLGFMN